MPAAANALLQATGAELARHAPFDSLGDELLSWLAERLALAYHPAGTTIVTPEGGMVDRMRIVKQGVVRAGAVEHPSPTDLVLGPGECFPLGALTGRRAAALTYRAVKDTFCWELAAADFHALLERSEAFRAFCLDHLSALVAQSHRARRAEILGSIDEAAGMLTPLRSAITRDAIACPPDAPVGEAIRAMHSARVGSMVVVDAARVPVGIFTTPDIVERVTLAQAPMDTPMRALMTPEPIRLDEEAPLVEAAVAMARHRIRHVVVTRDGRLAGVISERDLFTLQRVGLRRTTERIHAAVTIAELAEAANDSRLLARRFLAHGVGAEHLTQVTSALNDALAQRLLQVVGGRAFIERAGSWCWIALGSEGRLEQTLATDQDNALIFSARGDPNEAREALLRFAAEVNEGLAACGFPLCKGEIMASNPRWCLSLDEWGAVFDDWIRNPSPQALLNASVFFDFRALGGNASLAGALRERVLAGTKGNSRFARAMAESALQTRAPLGLLDGFETDDAAGLPASLDLKARGARLFVDAARVLSLAHALPPTGTAARLRAAGAAGVLPAGEVDASLKAFHFLQELRLRRQHLAADVAPGTENRIDPGALDAVDSRILKAAFRQAALLQDRLRLDFGL